MPVKVARTCPWRRCPITTAANATPAMMAAAYQCENEPNDRPTGVVDRDSEIRVTPPMRMRAPVTSETLTGCREIGTASTRAQIR